MPDIHYDQIQVTLRDCAGVPRAVRISRCLAACSLNSALVPRRYDGNEAVFMAAYPEADDGHTALLRAINRARRARGDILPRK